MLEQLRSAPWVNEGGKPSKDVIFESLTVRWVSHSTSKMRTNDISRKLTRPASTQSWQLADQRTGGEQGVSNHE